MSNFDAVTVTLVKIMNRLSSGPRTLVSGSGLKSSSSKSMSNTFSMYEKVFQEFVQYSLNIANEPPSINKNGHFKIPDQSNQIACQNFCL